MNLIQRSYVFVAGVAMMGIGAYTALSPAAYVASLQSTALADATLSPGVNLLSDLRGMGGLLLTASVFIVLSAFQSAWLRSAMVLSTVIYSVFVVFRVLGIVLDGLPETALMLALAIECVLSLLGFLLLAKTRFSRAFKEQAV